MINLKIAVCQHVTQYTDAKLLRQNIGIPNRFMPTYSQVFGCQSAMHSVQSAHYFGHVYVE